MIMLMIILFGRDQIEMSEFILPKYQYRDVQGDAGDFQSYSVYHAHFSKTPIFIAMGVMPISESHINIVSTSYMTK